MSTNDISISKPSILERPIPKPDPKVEKNWLNPRVTRVIISTLLILGGVMLILISQGVLPHGLNAFTQVLGHTGVRLLPYVGAACIGTGLYYLGKESLFSFIQNPWGNELAVRCIRWINREYDKKIAPFKNSIICKMRNASSLSALRGERVVDKFKDLRSKVLTEVREALNGEIDGHDHESFEEKKEKFLLKLQIYENEDYSSAQIKKSYHGGMCDSIESIIAKRVLEGENLEDVCKQYEQGADEDMLALHFLGETLPDDVFVISQSIGGIVGFGHKPVSDLSEDGLYKIRSKVTDNGWHTILIQRQGDNFYLLDSNFFLIKFDISEFGTKMRDFLAIYYETAQQIDPENFNDEALCRQFEVSKYFSGENLTWGVPYDEETASPYLLWGAEKKAN